jgi:hypothetical protein
MVSVHPGKTKAKESKAISTRIGPVFKAKAVSTVHYPTASLPHNS